VSALVLTVIVALSVLSQGVTSHPDGLREASGAGSISQASSELGVVSTTPRVSLGRFETDRGDRTGFGPGAVLIVGAAVFTLVASRVPPMSVLRPAVHGVIGSSVARAPPVTPIV